MLIHRSTLNAVLPATTADFLHAVECSPDGRVSATNGHVGFVAKNRTNWPSEDFPVIASAPFHASPEKPVLIPVDAVKRVIAGMPKKATIPILHTLQVSTNGSAETITVSSTDLTAPTVVTVNQADQGQFPNLERVIPAKDKAETVAVILGHEVLEAILKAAKAIKGSKTLQAVRLDVPTDEASLGKGSRAVITAIRITMTGEETDLYGAIMPCRE